MTTPATISTTIAADKVLGLVHFGGFTVAETGTLTFRWSLDMGVIHIPSGTAGAASVRGAVYIIENGDAAPTSGAANSYGHQNMSVLRNSSYATSYSLGSSILDESAAFAAGDWEMWGAVVVNSVGDLDGVTVSGTTPSGILEVVGGDGTLALSQVVTTL